METDSPGLESSTDSAEAIQRAARMDPMITVVSEAPDITRPQHIVYDARRGDRELFRWQSHDPVEGEVVDDNSKD